MSKKVMGNTHSSKTRERVSAPRKVVSARKQRRNDKRDERKALASLASHDPRAVRFNF
jgi:hypothetical protein